MKNRCVYLVMGHNNKTRNTYVSGVFSNKKKADEYRVYIDKIIRDLSPDDDRHYWILCEKVQ